MSNFLLVLFVGLYFIVRIDCKKNNVCPTYRDYYNKESNPHCSYDPDVFSEAIEIIIRHNYSYEVYTTITKDGYILNVYRLPPKIKNKSKGIVFLAHAAISNMIQWLDKGKQSLAFLLVKAGYDVWLGNFRGSLYSEKHVSLSRFHQPNEYYNYSFHEMGLYDMPAQLDLIRNISGSSSKMYVVGYSLSCTVAHIYASLLPKHAQEYVHVFILWAPTVFLNLEKTIMRAAVPFSDIALNIINFFNASNIFAYTRVTKLTYYICFEFPILSGACSNLLELLFGLNPEDSFPPLFPSLLLHNGYSLSPKTAVHLAQFYSSGSRFQWFDYGKNKNYYYYNSPIPPEYPLEDILSPMHYFYGSADILVIEKEVRRAYNMLRPELRHGTTEVSYNHINFVYGKNLYEKLFIPTIEIIENFPNKKSRT